MLVYSGQKYVLAVKDYEVGTNLEQISKYGIIV